MNNTFIFATGQPDRVCEQFASSRKAPAPFPRTCRAIRSPIKSTIKQTTERAGGFPLLQRPEQTRPPNSSERIDLSRFRRATRVSAANAQAERRDRARPWPQLVVWVIQSRFVSLNSRSSPHPLVVGRSARIGPRGHCCQ